MLEFVFVLVLRGLCPSWRAGGSDATVNSNEGPRVRFQKIQEQSLGDRVKFSSHKVEN